MLVEILQYFVEIEFPETEYINISSSFQFNFKSSGIICFNIIWNNELLILKSPTAPVNPSGISPGNSLTLITVCLVRKYFWNSLIAK